MKPRIWLSRGISLMAGSALVTTALIESILATPIAPLDPEALAFVQHALLVWILPSSCALAFIGYLLSPTRPLLRTRTTDVVRLGVAALGWMVGLFFLFTPFVIVWLQGLRLIGTQATLSQWRAVAMTTYLEYSIFFFTGLLALLSTQKWIRASESDA